MPTVALLSLAAASMFPTGAPQVYGPPPPPARTTPATAPSVTREVERIRSDIKEARASGDLTRRQARELRRETGEIDMLEQRYAQDGLTDAERAELRNRTEVVRAISNAKASGLIK